MTATVLIIAFGLLILLLLALLTRRRAAGLSHYGLLAQTLQPVPVAAVLNLIDPAQQEYLERKLQKADLARLRRIRNRALLEYFRVIYRNAGILLQLAHAAVQSERPEIAQAGRELTELALVTRTLSLRAVITLSIAIIVPSAAANLLPAVTKYVTATARSTSLTAMLADQRITA